MLKVEVARSSDTVVPVYKLRDIRSIKMIILILIENLKVSKKVMGVKFGHYSCFPDRCFEERLHNFRKPLLGSSYPSVCLPAYMELIGFHEIYFHEIQYVNIFPWNRFSRNSICEYFFHEADFHEIQYVNIFRKSIEKIQFSLKSDNNNG